MTGKEWIEEQADRSDFVLDTLEVSSHEQRLRYQAEMSIEEKSRFAALLREACTDANLESEIPEWL